MNPDATPGVIACDLLLCGFDQLSQQVRIALAKTKRGGELVFVASGKPEMNNIRSVQLRTGPISLFSLL